MKTMNNNFNAALNDALEKEFKWLEDFQNPYEEYVFSYNFEGNMNRIFNMPEYTYVSVGRKRVRKRILVALIALMVLLASGCATYTGYRIVKWNETQNDAQGTLDVTFDIENNGFKETEFHCVTPKTPEGYTVTKKTKNIAYYDIDYADKKNHVIYYSQDSFVDTMGLSIDNEDAIFKETVINGYKGYYYKKEGVSELIWTDGIYLYTLIGTCKMEVLEKMSEGVFR